MFQPKFSFHLNSEDLFCEELPLVSRRAAGGTMAIWKAELDPFVRILPTASAAVLPLLLSLPGYTPTAHITVYLPTHGRETEFVTALGALHSCLEQIQEDFSCPLYLRGDFNVNPNHSSRADLLDNLCTRFALKNLNFDHPTHHHFMGNGSADAQLDLLLYSGPDNHAETLSSIMCSRTNPLVCSHHDIILSNLPLPPEASQTPSSGLISAPRVPNRRVKILWDDDKIPAYENLVSHQLTQLMNLWQPPYSPTTFSLLLQSTNDILSTCAQSTNRYLDLSIQREPRPSRHPGVRAAHKKSLLAAKKLRLLKSRHPADSPLIAAAEGQLSLAKSEARSLTRAWHLTQSAKRDELLHTILSDDPRRLYSHIRSTKSGPSTSKIHSLKVAGKIYRGEQVCDGFFDSLSSLKAPDMTPIHDSSSYKQIKTDYDLILRICSAGIKVPPITGKDAMLLLHSLKPDVNDLHSITPAHYINAGLQGAIHFTRLLNAIIEDINLSSIDQLNSVWAMVLHKGHGKDKGLDRSYRTISTCPVIAKALDRHIGDLFSSGWAAAQADTQFQGSDSSHELAALLVTETVQHSLFVQKEPIFLLLLDAQSAFDKILTEICIRAAFLAGSEGEGLIFLDNRLKNRQTFVEWDKCLMGPISDRLGVEQGGILSDRLYKLANNAELMVTQRSNLGVHLGPVHIASIGQADDVALVSNCPHKLHGLLTLVMEYADTHHVTMVPEKTKLLCYSPKGFEQLSLYWKATLPITMSGRPVPFVEEAEHVGVLRSTTPGSMPTVLARISAHTRALHGVLFAGLARRHHGNPTASLRVHLLYGIPVLLSGLAALVLANHELDVLDLHHKVTLERLLKLYPNTPAPVVYFLSGSLPARALLHSRQLCLLAMIARLGSRSPLYRYGVHILSSQPPPVRTASKIWFLQVRAICLRYGLPDPLQVLLSPPPKQRWKTSVSRQILSYWRANLLAAADKLPSIAHLRLTHMSLTNPSPLLTSCYSSQYEVQKATVQIRMASGRYRTCYLRRHWSGDPSGYCKVPGCTPSTPGTLLHLATGQCLGLKPACASAAALWADFVAPRPYLRPILENISDSHPDDFLAFLLNPTTHPLAITSAQIQGRIVLDELCYLTRTWLHTLHSARYRALGLWQYL